MRAFFTAAFLTVTTFMLSTCSYVAPIFAADHQVICATHSYADILSHKVAGIRVVDLTKKQSVDAIKRFNSKPPHTSDPPLTDRIHIWQHETPTQDQAGHSFIVFVDKNGCVDLEGVVQNDIIDFIMGVAPFPTRLEGNSL